jgi:hypothetical protein
VWAKSTPYWPVDASETYRGRKKAIVHVVQHLVGEEAFLGEKTWSRTFTHALKKDDLADAYIMAHMQLLCPPNFSSTRLHAGSANALPNTPQPHDDLHPRFSGI